MRKSERVLVSFIATIIMLSLLLCGVNARAEGSADINGTSTTQTTGNITESSVEGTVPESTIPTPETATEVSTTRPFVPISVPKPVSVTTGNGYALFKWKGVPEAESYHVYRKVNNGSWEYYVRVKKNTLKYKDTKVNAGETYSYSVKAVVQGEESGFYEDGVTVTCMAKPTNVKVSNSRDTLYLSWKKCDGAQKYRVYRRKTGQSGWAYLGETTKTSYRDKKVANGTEYTYTVRGVSKYGNYGPYDSKGVTQVTLKAPKVTLKCTPAEIRISWTNLSKTADSYRIYRKTAGDSGWRLIKTVSSKTTSLVDKNVNKNRKYTYAVRQVKGKVLGSYAVDGVATTFYKAPKLNLTHSPKGVYLSWTKAPVGTGYYIDRKSESQKSWKRVATVSSIGKLSAYSNTSVVGEKTYYRIRVKGTNLVSYAKMIYGINPKKPVVALTYDDGPHSSVTNSILNTLEKYDSRATFFVVGNRVNNYKSAVKRAYDMGCEIGNHTYSHTTLTAVGNSTINSQISSTNKVVKNITGKAPTIVRTPGGAVNNNVLRQVNYPIVSWSVDTLDWKYRNSSSVLSSIKNNTRDGSIVLMHDLYSSTAAATQSAVPWLIDRGYQLVTVTELMQIKGVDFRPGKVYYRG